MINPGGITNPKTIMNSAEFEDFCRRRLKAYQLFDINAWYTIEDVVELSGYAPDRVRRIIEELVWGRGIIQVRVPRGGTRLVWHKTTSDTRQIAEAAQPVSMIMLPWWLKKTFIKKFEQLYAKGMVRNALPKWMRAELVVEEHLDRMRLAYTRRRPEDGFMYPCSWRVRCIPGQQHTPSTDNAYPFQIMFTGTISPKAPGLPLAEPIVEPGTYQGSIFTSEMTGLDCKLLHGSSWTTIEVYRVAQARVDAQTLKLQCPTGIEIVDLTRQKMWVDSTNWKPILQFMPLHEQFELLSEHERGGHRQ